MNDLDFFAAVIKALPDTVFEVDADGRFTFFHAPGHDNNGSEYVGTTVRDHLPAAAADLILGATQRCRALKQPQIIKYAVARPYEPTCTFQAHLGLVESRDTVVAIVRDITAEARHEAELNEQKRCLEEANTSLEQFVYLASHDLREPLSGVAGYATLLQKRYAYALDHNAAHFVDMIVGGTQNMEIKIDGLLSLSRINKGVLTGTFPLGAAVDSARRCLFGPLQGVDVEFQFPSTTTPLIRGDRGQITQVFQNLFSNSIKYRQEGQKLTIAVGVEDCPEQANMLRVSVKDNGIGFDMKHADRIFGVFQRLYTVHQYPGTGIGLAIVKKIVERHGGKVWPESEPGNGSTFFFTLPKA